MSTRRSLAVFKFICNPIPAYSQFNKRFIKLLYSNGCVARNLYTLRPLKIFKNYYTSFVQMYVTGRGTHDRHHKVYIFLNGIVDCGIPVCLYEHSNLNYFES